MPSLPVIAALQAAPAYIGPGAGFALGGSFLFALAGIALALLAVLLWPARVAVRSLRGRGRRTGARARRVIVLGLDGLDPGLARRWMEEGHLPHLDALRREGGFRPLGTTWPAMSPAAWATSDTAWPFSWPTEATVCKAEATSFEPAAISSVAAVFSSTTALTLSIDSVSRRPAALIDWVVPRVAAA